MEGICVNFLDQVQFFWFLKGRCHCNQFCVIPDLFTRSQRISGSAGPIFTVFATVVGIELQMINPTFFFRYLKGRCHGNQLVAKMGQNYLPPLHSSLCQSKMEWDIATSMGSVNSASDVSISRKNFVNFGPVTLEKTGLICILFYDMAKNSHI